MKIGYTVLRTDGSETRDFITLWPDLDHQETQARLMAGAAYEQVRQALFPVFGDNYWEHVTVFWDTAGSPGAAVGDTSKASQAGPGAADASGPAYTDMFVDENGQLKGLPVNTKATAIYRNNMLVHEPGRFLAKDMPDIVGDAVLFDERVWF